MMQKWLIKAGLKLLKKPKFRCWAELEDAKYEIVRATEQKSDGFAHLIYRYCSVALPIHPTDYSKVYWKDAVDAFLHIHRVTTPDVSIPLTTKHSDKKDKRDAWDYQGRLWFFYSNVLASAYGWSVSQIAKLHVHDALAYIQEILTDKQLEREFVWSTTEVAYVYSKQTKKSKFSPLERPYWMLPDIGKDVPPLTVKIRKSLLPVGNVISMNQERTAYETKKTQLGGDVESLSPSEASD